RCATDIDLETIGGTCGAATSALMNALIEPPQRIQSLLTYFEELSGRSTLMCNYATKYFLDLDTHLRNIRPILQAGARCAYIVGNSRLSNVEIYTETILARLFELNGYEVERIM